MAYSLSSLYCFNYQALSSSHRIMFHSYPKMSSESFRDNGKPENSVDSNMNVLRERISRIRRREKFVDRSCGWNYHKDYHICGKKDNHQAFISEFVELFGITCGSIGLVSLFGSLFIFLVSFLVFISKI